MRQLWRPGTDCRPAILPAVFPLIGRFATPNLGFMSRSAILVGRCTQLRKAENSLAIFAGLFFKLTNRDLTYNRSDGRHSSKLKLEKARLIILPSLLWPLSSVSCCQAIHPPTCSRLFRGPPAGYTGAPQRGARGLRRMPCAVLMPEPGQISITAPPTYVPGQTYPVTVTHTMPIPRGYVGAFS